MQKIIQGDAPITYGFAQPSRLSQRKLTVSRFFLRCEFQYDHLQTLLLRTINFNRFNSISIKKSNNCASFANMVALRGNCTINGCQAKTERSIEVHSVLFGNMGNSRNNNVTQKPQEWFPCVPSALDTLT